MSSSIEWTDETWNPTVGCSRVSTGCDGCYAIGVAHRAMQPAHVGLTDVVFRPHEKRARSDGSLIDWTGEVRCLPERLEQPFHWRRPRRIFVDSMSDLFHPDVPDSFIQAVFDTMASAGRHTFQVLTKRPQRMASWVNGCVDSRPMCSQCEPLPNVWLGTSVENQRYADLRTPHLLDTPAAVRFLSIEPLLGPVTLCRCDGAAYGAQAHPFIVHAACPLHGDVRVDWVIAGGESGPGARPMHPTWVRSIRDQCDAASIPFFFKQWGEWGSGPDPEDRESWTHRVELDGSFSPRPTWKEIEAEIKAAGWMADSGWQGMSRLGKKAAGRVLDGRTWDEMPVAS